MFASLVARWSVLRPNATAVVTPRGNLSYAQFNQLIDYVASQLATVLPETPQLVLIGEFELVRSWVLTLALARLGHVSAVAPKDRALLEQMAPNLVLVNSLGDDETRPLFSVVPPQWWEDWRDANQLPVRERAAWTDNARFIVSSGTTGLPKIVPFSHNLILKRIEYELLAQSLGPVLGAGTRLAVNIPGGIGGFLAPLVAWAVGGSVLFDIRPNDDPERFRAHNPTAVVMATMQLQLLLEQLPQSFAPMPNLTVTVGGSILSKSLAEEAQRRITPNIFVAYGSTEGGVACSALASTVDTERNEVGYRFPWVDIEIVGPDGVPLQSGEEGEVRVRSGASVNKYWSASENAQAQKQEDDWFYPGDTGSLSEAGILRISGRTGDVVNTGSRKLAFKTIEDVVFAAGGIKELAAFSVPNAHGMEQPWIAIVPESDFDRAKVEHAIALNRQLGKIGVLIVQTIPRNEMGKVQRHLLGVAFTAKTHH